MRVRERTLLIVPTRRTLVGFMIPESAAISLSERRSLTASGLRSVHYQGRRAAILDPMNEESREGLREIGNTGVEEEDDDACIITEVRVASRKRPREDNQEKEARRTDNAKRRELDSSETDRDKSSMPGV